MHGHALILSHKTVYLFAIVSNRRQDCSQGLEAHGYIQEVSCEEEVVVVSQDGHGHVPGQIQEGLQTQWSGKKMSGEINHVCLDQQKKWRTPLQCKDSTRRYIYIVCENDS